MTQEQEDRFFKNIKVDFRSRISGGICNLAPVYNEDELKKIEGEYKKMFLALVEDAILFEMFSTEKEDPRIQLLSGFRFDDLVEAIESASGLPWSEVREIYKECLG